MALNPGDIAFVQQKGLSAVEQNFAFVALVDIPAGAEIRFTDRGWLSGSNTFQAPSSADGTAILTIPAGGVSAGTIVTISLDLSTVPSTPLTSVGSISSSGGGDFFLGGNFGDQIIAYQESGGSITPIAAFQVSGNPGAFQADATNDATSALPQGLVEGTSAIALNQLENYVVVLKL